MCNECRHERVLHGLSLCGRIETAVFDLRANDKSEGSAAFRNGKPALAETDMSFFETQASRANVYAIRRALQRLEPTAGALEARAAPVRLQKQREAKERRVSHPAKRSRRSDEPVPLLRDAVLPPDARGESKGM